MRHGIDLRPGYARSILLIMLAVLGLIVAASWWQSALLRGIYLSHQLTSVGLVVNSTIVVLFLLGLARLAYILLRIGREEQALDRLIQNLHDKIEDPLRQINSDSWAAQRVVQIAQIAEQSGGSVDQAPLAATLTANQHRLLSFPRFVQNILILVGVFGTIMSLSLALLGASEMLEGEVGANGMGLVIHGMSTALSTTITAIVCYITFSYFVIRTADAQTRVVAALENTSAQFLLPRYRVESESVLYELGGLINTLQGVAEQMRKTQAHSQVLLHRLGEASEDLRSRMNGFGDDIGSIRDYLRRGFRLSDKD